MMRLAVLTSLILACCSLCIAQDTTCGIVWYPPIQLSAGVGGLPKIAVTGDTVHVIWRGNEALRLPYRRSTNNGFSFEPVRELLVDSATFWREPGGGFEITAVTDTLLVTFAGTQSGTGFSPVHLLRSSDRGTLWGIPVKITSDTTGTISCISSAKGAVALLYAKVTGPTQTLAGYGILRSHNGINSWTSVFDERFSNFTRLALSPFISNFVLTHLVNHINPVPAIQYRRSIDLGTSWFDSTIISSANGNASIEPDIAVGVDDSGGVRVFTAWRDNKYGCGGLVGCSVMGRQSLDAGTTFLPETLLTEMPTGYGAKIAVSGRHIAVAWDEEVNVLAHANVRVSLNGGLAWCPVMDVTPDAFSASSTRVAISENAVHLVWMQRDSIGGGFYVWYRGGVFLTTEVEPEVDPVPSVVRVCQNYPNPFNPRTIINYQLTTSNWVTLKAFDMLGREVAVLVNEKMEIGEHSVEWNAEGLPSGVYYYRIYSGGTLETRKAVLLR